jgi:hypothetical protein
VSSWRLVRLAIRQQLTARCGSLFRNSLGPSVTESPPVRNDISLQVKA